MGDFVRYIRLFSEELQVYIKIYSHFFGRVNIIVRELKNTQTQIRILRSA